MRDRFSTVAQGPVEASEAVELESVTFGVFEETLGEYGAGGCNYDRVVREVLAPWLLAAQRYVGVNDLIDCGAIQVKVLAAHPFWGFVGQRTAIMCYQTLSFRPLDKIKFCILSSEVPDNLNAVFGEFFRGGEKHFHSRKGQSEQYFFVQGFECIVVKCKPDNGLANNCNISFSGLMLPLFSLDIGVCEETLPGGSTADLMQRYVAPYFSGWRRSITQPELDICGVQFRVLSQGQPAGYVTPFTQLILRDRPLRPEESGRLVDFKRIMKLLKGNSMGRGHQLPVRVLQAVPEDADLKSCVICMEEFEIGVSVKTLPCCTSHTVHLFHEGCIDSWLKKHEDCPICKNPVDHGE